MINSSLREKLDIAPDSPGVYLMKGANREVLYVGKAASLRHRVRSYFQDSAKPYARTIEIMIRNVTDIEFILTDNEVEALILENSLVKKYQPRYNVKLKDDKRYPYIRITTNEPFPKIEITRIIKRDGAKYFGPYAHSASIRQTLKQLTKVFSVRSCDLELEENGNRYRPCLDYHINRCPGPCADLIDKEKYSEIVKNAVMFLSGHKELLIDQLQHKMKAAAANLQFELAAQLRDRIAAIERVSEKQKLDTGIGEDIDTIAYAQKDDEACVQIFMIRDGKLLEREHFFLTDTAGWSSSEIIAAFLQQYYLDASFIPRNILIQSEVEMADTIEKWLESKKQGAVSLHVPQKGEKKALIDLVAKNAVNTLEQKRFYTVFKQGDNPALIELGRLLNLPKQPNRIEAFDISNLGENLAVGSMVVFESGEPTKSEYRRFRIKSVKGQNDFAMMQEVVFRRYKRALEEGKMLPDLILIDGGKGQLSSAYSALESLGLEETPIIGLAKQFEHIFVPQSSDPIILPKESLVLHLIQRLRDEAHRFANTYHRTLRDKTMKESILDEIPGIGQKRKFALLQKFGSLEAIAAASIDELRAVEGMNQRVAERIKKQLSAVSFQQSAVRAQHAAPLQN